MKHSSFTIVVFAAVLALRLVHGAAEHRTTWDELTGVQKIYLPIIAVSLVLLDGIISGLLLAIFSLDVTYLRVCERTGDESERKAADRLLPLVTRHHLTLVTLLMMNAAVMTACPIVLETMVDPIHALLLAVTAVLVFGEIIPQATFVRHAVASSVFFSPFVWFCIGLTFIVSYPASKVLDYIVGHKSEVLERDTLAQFFRFQGQTEHSAGNGLSLSEVNTINGALHLTQKKVKELMKVPAAKVFMLSSSTRLNEATVQEILLKGFSRIPVYSELDRSHIVGVLLAKSLLRMAFTNLENPPMCGEYHLRELLRVSEDAIVEDLYIAFQNGQSHMAAVYNRQGLFSGIVTLEDIFEELHSVSIPDEFDLTQTNPAQIEIRQNQLLTLYGSVKERLRSQEGPQSHNASARSSAFLVRPKTRVSAPHSSQCLAASRTASSPQFLRPPNADLPRSLERKLPP